MPTPRRPPPQKRFRPATVRIAPEKQQLIGVAYGAAEYEAVTDTIRAAARVTLDETRISKVQSRLEGWIDKVFADFTGRQVRQGDPLLTIYSPEALATQQEYLLALRAQRAMSGNPLREMTESTANLVAAARKRLELFDIGGRQLDEIARTGQPVENLTLEAPFSGFVMERNAYPKQHVTPETVLYTVADLSTVWVIADVYEYEAAAVRLDQPATLTLSYAPGRVFRGRVSYILPQVDPATRTLKVRLAFDNPGFALKPDMYGEVQFADRRRAAPGGPAIGGAQFRRPPGGLPRSRQRRLRAARRQDRRPVGRPHRNPQRPQGRRAHRHLRQLPDRFGKPAQSGGGHGRHARNGRRRRECAEGKREQSGAGEMPDMPGMGAKKP